MFNRKRKYEKIETEITEVIRENNISDNDFADYYTERVNEVINEHSLNSFISLEEKISKINNDFKEFNKKKTQIIKWYYITRLFSPSVIKNDKYNEKSLRLEKELNGLKRIYDDLSRKLKKFNVVVEHTDTEVEDIFNQINGLYDYANDYIHKQEDFKKQYFSNLKVSSVTICEEKTIEELDKFVKDIEELVITYGSIERTKDFVFYNSGDLIDDLIDLLLIVVKSTNNDKTIEKYTFKYFLDSDAVLTLKYNEWINLYSKLSYVLKNIANYDEIEMLKFIKKFKEFEIRYMVLLIAHEMETKRK